MLNFLADIIMFPIRALKKVPNVNLGNFIPLRFLLAVVFAFASAGCFVTANQGYHRLVFIILGWVFIAAVIDVFIYANNEEKAIESEEKLS